MALLQHIPKFRAIGSTIRLVFVALSTLSISTCDRKYIAGIRYARVDIICS